MSNLFNKKGRPYVIAGPCSVESRVQLASVVKALAVNHSVDMIRCGVWKPRTRPGGFEGLGEPALIWIDEQRELFPEARFCCEVARPEHVELCLKHKIDAVWIGARTSGDPFSVGEIAQALQGSGLAVMVKNPLTADVRLWQGAIERIMSSGAESIAAIHRGFYQYNDNSGYRNTPLWEVPIELRRLMPELPIICDPSHIGGDAKYLFPLMQTASDLGANGYMIEVHPNPFEALTDNAQQIVPDQLDVLLKQIVRRCPSPSDNSDLERLRKQIDAVDNALISKLAERMRLSAEIAQIKSESNMTIFQPKRWDEILHKRIEEAHWLGLDEEFVKSLYEKIHAESVRVQETSIGNSHNGDIW